VVRFDVIAIHLAIVPTQVLYDFVRGSDCNGQQPSLLREVAAFSRMLITLLG
jgi:hypothetical protein